MTIISNCTYLKLFLNIDVLYLNLSLETLLLFCADLISFCPATLIDGEPIIKLPPKSIDLAKVDFTAEERAFYTQLEAESRSQFKVPFICIICSHFQVAL